MAIHIQRREFISTLVGGAAAASPIVACADSGKVARIGYLSPDSPTPAATALFDAFCDGLRELGWIKGKNVIVELRYAENRVERLPEAAAELVRINVDVIVLNKPHCVIASKQCIVQIDADIRVIGFNQVSG